MSPFDPLGHWNASGLAAAHLAARQFEQAIEWADRALRDQPRFVRAIRVKIVATANLGRLDEARAELGRALALYPGFIRRESSTSIAPEIRELFDTGLRLAGLPEG